METFEMKANQNEQAAHWSGEIYNKQKKNIIYIKGKFDKTFKKYLPRV